MTQQPITCPKCGGEMQQGFIPDNTYGGRLVNQWAPGVPEASFWTGTKMPEKGTIPIGVFRCSTCGFLEMYARSEFASK